MVERVQPAGPQRKECLIYCFYFDEGLLRSVSVYEWSCARARACVSIRVRGTDRGCKPRPHLGPQMRVMSDTGLVNGRGKRKTDVDKM